ncbi:MAG: glycosyltransferase [Alphaproteobacteria bacterium]
MKVIIVAFKDLERNTRVFRQAAALSSRGHDVTVFALQNPDRDLMRSGPDIRFVETGVLAFDFPKTLKIRDEPAGIAQRLRKYGRGLWRRTVMQLFTRRYVFAREAARRFRGDRFDLILAHDHHSILAATAIKLFASGTLAVDYVEAPYHHDHKEAGPRPGFFRRIEIFVERQLLRLGRLSFTVSHGLADLLKERGFAASSHVIRNVRYHVAVSGQSSIRQDAGLGEGQKLIVHLNTVYAGQGVEEVIEAMPFVARHIRFATLGKFAPPDYETFLREKARSLGVSERVSFLPLVKSPDLLDYLSGADAGVNVRQRTTLNNRISLPNRVFEMIGAELPVVSTTIRDMRNIVETYGVGVICDETNPRDIAEKINFLMHPDNLPRYKRNCKIAFRELCWDREGEIFSGILEEHLSSRADRR